MQKICSKCGEIKPLSDFYKMTKSPDGHRPDCIECHLKQKEKYKNENPLEYTLRVLSHTLLDRIKHADKPKNKCYQGIKCELGNTYDEVYQALKNNFAKEIEKLLSEGKRPSVDRINSNKNYSIDNIQIIELLENCLKGCANAVKVTSKPIKVTFPDGSEQQFDSVSSASRDLKIKRDTINAHLDGSPTRKGLKFEYV
jgi:protein-arginine kinase activator protein McsA